MAGTEARQSSPNGQSNLHGSPPYPRGLYQRSDSVSTSSPLSPTSSQDRRESFHLQNSGLYSAPASSSRTSLNHFQQQQQQQHNQRRLNPTHSHQTQVQHEADEQREELDVSTENVLTPLGFPPSYSSSKSGNNGSGQGGDDESPYFRIPWSAPSEAGSGSSGHRFPSPSLQGRPASTGSNAALGLAEQEQGSLQQQQQHQESRPWHQATPLISLTGVSPGRQTANMTQSNSSTSSSSTPSPQDGGQDAWSMVRGDGRQSRSSSFGRSDVTPSASVLLSGVSPRSPTNSLAGSEQPGRLQLQQQQHGGSGFFSSFRPSSSAGRDQSESSTPSIREPQDRAPSETRRRDRGLNASEQRSRRPSSVLEQVGGIFDRFGKKLGHSRNESKDAASKRPSSTASFAGLNGSALDVGSSSNTDEVEEVLNEHSPNGSTMSHQFSPSVSAASSPAPWERASAESMQQQQQQQSSSSQGANTAGPASLRSPLSESAEPPQTPSSWMQRQFSAGSLSSAHGLPPASEASGSSSLAPAPAPAPAPAAALAVSSTSTSTSRASKRLSVLDRTFIQVTEDNERFSVVDISSLDSSAAIKERMLSKLHLFDEEASSFALYRTEIGMSSASGPKIDDDELLAMCWQLGDDRGTLKFLLQQTAPSAQPSRVMPPPPVAASPRKAMQNLANDGLSAPLHAKSGSLSSRSSVSEVLGQHGDALSGGGGGGSAANESGSETSSSRHHLHRSKATSRRAGQGSVASSAEDVRSPTFSTRSTPSNSGLGSVSEQVLASSSSTIGAGSYDKPPSAGAGHQADDSSMEEVRDLDEDEGTLTSSRPFGKLRRPLSQSSHQAQPTTTTTVPASPAAVSASPMHQPHGLPDEVSSPSDAFQRGQGSRGSSQSRPGAQRTTSQPHVGAPSESSGSGSTSAGSSGGVPKSLQAGGREPRGLDHADAAHMYLGGALSSPRDDFEYPPLSPASTMGGPTSIHGTKSMEDIRLNKQRRHPSFPSAAEMPANAKQQILKEQMNPLDIRDGRYPRPDVAAVPHSASTNGSGGPAYHPSSHWQSPPPPHHRHPQGPPPLPQPSVSVPPTTGGYHGDAPGAFDRNRSASAGNLMPFKMGRPPPQLSDPRLAGNARAPPMQSPPMARPLQHQQPQHAPMNYYPSDPRYGGPPPAQMLRPGTSVNEFGARSPFDPRPFPVRPHTFHEHQRFRPGGPPPTPPPAPLALPQREDPFTSMHFPNSSSREVSAFQRHAVASQGSLQPGMTVQETMHRPSAPTFSPQSTHQQPFGPRDYRTPRPSNRSYDWPSEASLTSPHGPPPPHSAIGFGSMNSSRPSQQQHSFHHHYPQHPPQAQQHVQQYQPQYHQHQLPQQQQPQQPQQPQQHHYDQQQQQQVPVEVPYVSSSRRSIPSTFEDEERQSSARNQQGQAMLQKPLQPQQARMMRPHTAAVDGTGPSVNNTQHPAQGSERSSGSSFASSASHASHRRNISSDEGVQKPRDANDDSFSAPTSARSSQSGPLSPETKEPMSAASSTQLPYASSSTSLSRKASLDDSELLKMRPLPTPPSQPSSAVADDREHVEELRDAPKDSDTLKVGDWRKVISSLSARTGDGRGVREGDLLEDSDSSTLRAGAAPSSAASSVFASGAQSSGAADATSRTPTMAAAGAATSDNAVEGQKTRAAEEAQDEPTSWDDFEDDEEELEGGTWMKPMAPKEDVAASLQPLASGSGSKDKGKDARQLANEDIKPLTDSPASLSQATLRPDETHAIHRAPGSPGQAASPHRPVLTIQINGPNASTGHHSPSLVQHGLGLRHNVPTSSPRVSPQGPKSPPKSVGAASRIELPASLTMTPTKDEPGPPLSENRRPSSSSTTTTASSSSSGSNLHRSTSFARRDDTDWASRPPPELLYENLDDFFPKLDLDKPVLEAANAPGSPLIGSEQTPVSNPAAAHAALGSSSLTPLRPISPPAAVAPTLRAGGGGGAIGRHKKSIRIVAQDRKRFMDRAEAIERRHADAQAPGDDEADNRLARRRSTKLWGGRVVEVTPGVDPTSATSLESPSSEGGSGRPVFKWVKGDLIGRGTYGRVYLALNATTGEMIAVKQVELPTTASDREDIRQKNVVAALKSEIETLKDLDHPNIVSYLGYEETRQTLSIFLEYVPGGSVGSCLRKHGKLEEATIKSFLNQILEGLSYLHGRNILHRDLKADNLLVDHQGTVKISDFGTVRKSEDIYGNVASMSVQGSIFWMAPEVMSLSSRGYSAKVDIWSLGCVVLEMFAGRRPWSEEEAVHAMFKIGAERKAPPIPPDVRLSKAATHFLKTCFYVDPTKRPTASRLLEHVFPHPLEGWQFEQSSLYQHLAR